MADPNKRSLVLIIDCSGSMTSIKTATEEGVNALLTQQAAEEVETTVSLYTFSDEWEIVADEIPIAEVESFVLTPRTSTALLDTIGDVFVRERDKRKGLPKDQRPGNVHYVIATDGQENSSRRWTYSQVADLLKKEGKRPERVIQFMGANQDAIATAAKMGIRSANSITYAANVVGTRNTWEAASASMSSGLEGGDYAFTPQMRASTMLPDGPGDSLGYVPKAGEAHLLHPKTATSVVGQVDKPQEDDEQE